MSYCRWSSDDWRCDLYCYEHVAGGWMIHVAGNRPLNVPRNDEPFIRERIAEWSAKHNAQLDYLRDCPREDIALPHAGETFNEPTLAKFARRLLELRAIGYSFPDYVLALVGQQILDGEDREIH